MLNNVFNRISTAVPNKNTSSTNKTFNLSPLAKVICSSLFAFSVTAHSADAAMPGSLDPTFGVDGVVTTNLKLAKYGMTGVTSIKDQNGNTFVVGHVKSDDHNIFVSRINADGQPDNEFGDNGTVISDFGGVDEVLTLFVDSNNRLLVVGKSDGLIALSHYSSSGVPDSGFGTNGVVNTLFDAAGLKAAHIAIDGEDRLMLPIDSADGLVLTRLLINGIVDETFGVAGRIATGMSSSKTNSALTFDQQNNIFVTTVNGSNATVAKYDSSGDPDSDFGTDGQAQVSCCESGLQPQIALDSTGHVIVASRNFVVETPGSFADFERATIIRLTSAGQLDNSFGENGVVNTTYDSSGKVQSLTVDHNDGLWLTSQLYDFWGPVLEDTPRGFAIHHYNSSGQLDSGFFSGGVASMSLASTSAIHGPVQVDENGYSILMAGTQLEPVVSRFTLDGQTITTTLGVAIDKVSSTVSSTLSLDPQGQLLLSGKVVTGDRPYEFNPFIAKFDPLGQIDSDFGYANSHHSAHYSSKIATINSDGSYLAIGRNYLLDTDQGAGFGRYQMDTSLMRFDAAGNIDSNFAERGLIHERLTEQQGQFNNPVAFANNGQILMAAGNKLFRYNADGQADADFGVDGQITLGFNGGMAIKPQRNGDIFVVGDSAYWDDNRNGYLGGTLMLAKYHNDGTVKADFGTNGLAQIDLSDDADRAYNMAIDSQQRIVVVAQKEVNSDTDSRITLLRYLANGQLDTSFGTDGLAITPLSQNFVARHVIIDSNNNIVVAGADNTQLLVARFSSDGKIDKTFGQDGITHPGQNDDADHQTGLVLDDSGHLYLSTTLNQSNSQSNNQTNNQSSGLLKLVSGYPSLNNDHAASVLFNRDTAKALTVTEFAFDASTANSLNQIELASIPADGQLFIDANNNGLKDTNETALLVDAAISKAQLDNGQLFYQPDATSTDAVSAFAYRFNNNTDSQALRLLANPAPQSAITSPVSEGTTDANIPMQIRFSEAVYGFEASQLNLSNATVTEFSGDGKVFDMVLTATAVGVVSVQIPDAVTVDYNGANNVGSALSVTYTAPEPTLTIGGEPQTSVDEDNHYELVLTIAESGLSQEQSDAITFSIENPPSWASFDTATGVLSGTPTNDDVGTTNGIVITVTAGELTDSTAPFDLEVVNTNDAPVISGTPSTTINQDQAYSFIPTASDVDVSDTLSFAISNMPSWATFDSATGALTGTPAATDIGTFADIRISVADGNGVAVGLDAFAIEVNAVTAPGSGSNDSSGGSGGGSMHLSLLAMFMLVLGRLKPGRRRN